MLIVQQQVCHQIANTFYMYKQPQIIRNNNDFHVTEKERMRQREGENECWH